MKLSVEIMFKRAGMRDHQLEGFGYEAVELLPPRLGDMSLSR